jgi:hypothetical protein
MKGLGDFLKLTDCPYLCKEPPAFRMLRKDVKDEVELMITEFWLDI